MSGVQPSLAQSQVYTETMAGLGNSNFLTAYVNLAPIQGLGFLAEGLGLGQVSPLYGSIAKCIENMQALGVGLGYDGDAVAGLMQGDLSRTQIEGHGSTAVSVAMYRMQYIVTDRDVYA